MPERRKRSRLSIGLRTLLLLMLSSGCVVGLIGREVRQAQRREQAAKDLGRAASKIEVEYCGFWGNKVEAPPPAWQRRLLGEHFFLHITAVAIGNANELPVDGGLLADLQHLQLFESTSNLNDRQLAALSRLRRLEQVALTRAAFNDQAVMSLSLENPLRSLDLSQTGVTDAGLKHIVQFETLETLDLSHTLITDAGVKQLAKLPNLKSLTLRRVQVSEEGILALKDCKSLERLELVDLPVSSKPLVEIAKSPRMKELMLGWDDRPGSSKFRSNFLADMRSARLRISSFDLFGPTSVFWAIDRRHVARNTPYLRWLLEHGADPNAMHDALSAVGVLANRNAREPLEVLLEFGADLNQRAYISPLTAAADRGHLDMMRFLIARGATIEPEPGLSPLVRACHARQLQSVQLLVEQGADVNRVLYDGDSPLNAAAPHPRIVQFLLENGANPYIVDHHGDTPLHRAAAGGVIESVKLLLEHGADPSLKNVEGQTPLSLVPAHADKSLAELLKEHHSR